MRKNHGGVLIEFAFSIPIIISLLFFVNDHYRLYDLKNKLRASAYLTASMIQQVTNNRSNKQLRISDVERIAYASCLNLFNTDTMFEPWPAGIIYRVYCQYVKRISHDQYQLQPFYADIWRPISIAQSSMVEAIENRSSSEIKNIHPDLLCDNDDDERVLINCWYEVIDAKATGLFFLKPVVGSVGYRLDNKGSFSDVVIITPKPGLFPVASN